MEVSITSPVIKSVHWAAAAAALFFLVTTAPFLPWLTPLPFVLVCMCAGEVGLASGTLLAFVWTLWLCLCFSPLFLYFGSPYCLFVVYVPALVFLKSPSTPPSATFNAYLYAVWDLPQLLWINAGSVISLRAITVRSTAVHV